MTTQANENFDVNFCTNIGSILLKRLYDTNWEVKDSTIEAIIAMVNAKANS